MPYGSGPAGPPRPRRAELRSKQHRGIELRRAERVRGLDSHASPLILGVDGGNSKTLAVVAEACGRALGVGRSRSGSHQAIGFEASMVEIRSAASQALDMAGKTSGDLDAAFFALAGADLEEDFVLL